jgi:polyisoprenoid-binding protein YceI
MLPGSWAWRRFVGPAALLLAAPFARAEGPGGAPWELVPEASQVLVHVFKAGALSGVLHDHHFRGDAVTGSLTFNPKDPTSTRGEVVLRVSSLREVHSELDESDQKKVVAEMLGPGVLDSASHPAVQFRIEGFEVSSSSPDKPEVQGDARGELTLRGSARALRLPVRVTWGPEQLRVTGRASINQSDFGITPLKKAFGTIQVKDAVTFDVELTFRTAARKAPAP